MPQKSHRAAILLEAVDALEGQQATGRREVSNSARLERLQAMPSWGQESSHSHMVGELDTLQRWLEAGPDELDGLRAQRAHFDLPALTGRSEGAWAAGPLEATGHATATADDQGLRGSLAGRATGERNGFTASATGNAGVAQGTDGSSSLRGRASASVGQRGRTGGIDHAVGGNLSVDHTGRITPSAQVSASTTAELGDWDTTTRGSASLDQRGVSARAGTTLSQGDTTARLGVQGGPGSDLAAQAGLRTRHGDTAAELGLKASRDKGLSAEATAERKLGNGTVSAGLSADRTDGVVGGLGLRQQSGTLSSEVKLDTRGNASARMGGSESAQLWSEQDTLANGATATARAGGAQLSASLGGRRTQEGSSLEAELGAALTAVQGQIHGDHELVQLQDQALGVDGTLAGAVEARGQAKGTAKAGKDGAELGGDLSLFAGAKASAELVGTVDWKRKDDYGPMIADWADNLPGNWDDRMLDRVPESFWTRAGTWLFGKGDTELVRAGVGVDARAGAGAEAKGSLTASNGGMLAAEADVGAALGVGGGVKGKLGLNPLGLLRRGLAAGMGFTNDLARTGEGWIRGLRHGVLDHDK